MDAILGVMSFSYNLFSKGYIRGHTDHILVPEHSLFIFSKFRTLALLHELLDFLDFRALLLGFEDSTFDVVQHSKFIQHSLW